MHCRHFEYAKCIRSKIASNNKKWNSINSKISNIFQLAERLRQNQLSFKQFRHTVFKWLLFIISCAVKSWCCAVGTQRRKQSGKMDIHLCGRLTQDDRCYEWIMCTVTPIFVFFLFMGTSALWLLMFACFCSLTHTHTGKHFQTTPKHQHS